MLRRTLLFAVAAASLTGCGLFVRKVDVRYNPNFPRRPEGAQVDLWVGETSRPNIPIAVISSRRTAERSREAREAQIEELRERARRMGADAIENVRVETAEVRGFVGDPMVPFTAWKQGEFELYFVRGTAIRYTGGAPPMPADPPQGSLDAAPISTSPAPEG
ncbi:MAG: heavy metal-binding domain-containing protein [Candidatus Sumerlaeia bacterium]|nr:heavy metal-binding domain-containing protein [Candidatus Sumerlaeia bacterium]